MNRVWANRQGPCGGPLAKLLFLHICDAIPEHDRDPRLETSLGFLAGFTEATLFDVSRALDLLEARRLIIFDWPPLHFGVGDNRLILRIPFPGQPRKAPRCPPHAPSSPSSA